MSYGSWNVYCPCERLWEFLLEPVRFHENSSQYWGRETAEAGDRTMFDRKKPFRLVHLQFLEDTGPCRPSFLNNNACCAVALLFCHSQIQIIQKCRPHCKCICLDAPVCSANISILHNIAIILPIFASLLPRVFAKHHCATMQLHAILVWMFYKLTSFSTSVRTKSANKASQPQLLTLSSGCRYQSPTLAMRAAPPRWQEKELMKAAGEGGNSKGVVPKESNFSVCFPLYL